MTADEIKQIRIELNLTQDQLANILGVNKSTVTRWEMDNNSRPTGESERKLLLLQKFFNNEDEKNKILDIKNIGGISSIAALLAAGISLFPVTKMVGCIALSAILSSLNVFNIFSKK